MSRTRLRRIRAPRGQRRVGAQDAGGDGAEDPARRSGVILGGGPVHRAERCDDLRAPVRAHHSRCGLGGRGPAVGRPLRCVPPHGRREQDPQDPGAHARRHHAAPVAPGRPPDGLRRRGRRALHGGRRARGRLGVVGGRHDVGRLGSRGDDGLPLVQLPPRRLLEPRVARVQLPIGGIGALPEEGCRGGHGGGGRALPGHVGLARQVPAGVGDDLGEAVVESRRGLGLADRSERGRRLRPPRLPGEGGGRAGRVAGEGRAGGRGAPPAQDDQRHGGQHDSEEGDVDRGDHGRLASVGGGDQKARKGWDGGPIGPRTRAFDGSPTRCSRCRRYG